VTDQISLPSDTKPLFGFNDPESGEESQWSGRTQPFISSNAIPNVTKSIATLLEGTTNGPAMTEEAESATEIVVSTTEAATLLLTALPNITTTTEKTTVSLAVFVLPSCEFSFSEEFDPSICFLFLYITWFCYSTF
jgi:hypothetical protein